jgi:hypothetical protein
MIMTFVILGIAAVVLLVDRLRMRLADVTDEEFIERYSALFEGSAEEALMERRYLSKTLGLPARKLAPEQTWEQLAKHAPLISFPVGTSDVADDLNRLLSHADIEVPRAFPSTIGATIQELIRARGGCRARRES